MGIWFFILFIYLFFCRLHHVPVLNKELTGAKACSIKQPMFSYTPHPLKENGQYAVKDTMKEESGQVERDGEVGWRERGRGKGENNYTFCKALP